MMTRTSTRLRLLRLGLALGAAALTAAPAGAAEVPCGEGQDALPCALQIAALQVEPGPAAFRFQARLEQAKLPLGTLENVVVQATLLRGRTKLCAETLSGVTITDSLLTLSIGHGLSCPLDRILAETPGRLALEICVADRCLKPVELDGAPYAMKATVAYQAQDAASAQVATLAHYAHRAAADRGMLANATVSTGYMDFSSPTPAQAGDLYPGAAFGPWQDTGFIAWTPVATPGSRRLLIAGRSATSDATHWLDELVLGAQSTRVHGDLDVSGDTTMASTLVVRGAARFTNTTVQGYARVDQTVAINGTLHVGSNLGVGGAGKLVTGGGALVVRQPFTTYNKLTAERNVTLGDAATDALHIQGSATVPTANFTANGPTTAGNTQAGPTTAQKITVSGDAHFVPDLRAGGLHLVTDGTAGTLQAGNTAVARFDGAGKLVSGTVFDRLQSIYPTQDGVYVHHIGEVHVITTAKTLSSDPVALSALQQKGGFWIAYGEKRCYYDADSVTLYDRFNQGAAVHLYRFGPAETVHLRALARPQTQDGYILVNGRVQESPSQEAGAVVGAARRIDLLAFKRASQAGGSGPDCRFWWSASHTWKGGAP